MRCHNYFGFFLCSETGSRFPWVGELHKAGRACSQGNVVALTAFNERQEVIME